MINMLSKTQLLSQLDKTYLYCAAKEAELLYTSVEITENTSIV